MAAGLVSCIGSTYRLLCGAKSYISWNAANTRVVTVKSLCGAVRQRRHNYYTEIRYKWSAAANERIALVLYHNMIHFNKVSNLKFASVRLCICVLPFMFNVDYKSTESRCLRTCANGNVHTNRHSIMAMELQQSTDKTVLCGSTDTYSVMRAYETWRTPYGTRHKGTYVHTLSFVVHMYVAAKENRTRCRTTHLYISSKLITF